MTNKFTKWLIAQKKDVKMLLICFVIAFVLYLIITQNFSNALEAGFGWMFFAVIAINAIRFWRGIGRRVGIPPTAEYNIELDEKEKTIFNEIVILPNIKELSANKKIDEIIKEKILSKNYCKEDWQINYAKERIRNAIIKQINPNN